MVAALKFFQSSDDPEPTKDSDDSDDEINPQAKALANKFNKKTRKRKNMLEKTKKAAAKEKKKKGDAPSFNFSALNLIHDPQSFAEKLFAQLEKRHERFEVRLMTIDVISRLIGLHQLFLFNFYPYIQRFLQPHQKGKFFIFISHTIILNHNAILWLLQEKQGVTCNRECPFAKFAVSLNFDT